MSRQQCIGLFVPSGEDREAAEGPLHSPLNHTTGPFSLSLLPPSFILPLSFSFITVPSRKKTIISIFLSPLLTGRSRSFHTQWDLMPVPPGYRHCNHPVWWGIPRVTNLFFNTPSLGFLKDITTVQTGWRPPYSRMPGWSPSHWWGKALISPMNNASWQPDWQ